MHDSGLLNSDKVVLVGQVRVERHEPELTVGILTAVAKGHYGM